MSNDVEERKLATFETATRSLRWGSLLVVLLTFPWQAPQALPAICLIAMAAAYNACRSIPFFYRLKAVRSPLSVIAIDCLFGGMLLALVGAIDTPYTGLLIFMIVSAAYFYRLPGAALVVAAEVILLLAELLIHPFSAIVIGTIQSVVLILFVLSALGYLAAKLTDIDSAERAALHKMQHSSELERLRLLALINSLDLAIFVTDEKGRLTQMNDVAKTFVHDADNAIGREFSRVLHLYKNDDPKASRVNILKDMISVQRRRDLSFTNKDGKKIDLDINVTQVFQNQAAAAYLIVCTDISQERTLEDQRSGFIAVASHELRTPLTIVEGSLAVALSTDKNLAPSTREVLEQAHRNTLQLSNIIKDFAIMSEAQNHSIPIQLSWVTPDALVDECAADFEAQANQRGLTLKKEIAADLPKVMSTEHYIREILQNYLTNALKYTQKGTVTIKAEPAPFDGVRFSVSDQGIGISRNDQKMIFTKFFRAEDYRTRTTGGVGLGLYLCMELANRLGAKVWFTSKLNEGSTFYLDVPVQSTVGKDQGEIIRTHVANLIDEL